MIGSSRRRNLFICLCLTATTLAVYWPIRYFGFVSYDDSLYITGNPHVRDGLTVSGFVWALTTPLDHWMPVTWLARMLECELFGLDAGVHHLANVLLHAADALLLFGVLQRMTAAPWRSAFVAALFALHPMHVESVAWVTELKDVLSAFFLMLTIWAYVRYVEQPKISWYLLTLGLYPLGLMSKPMLVTLPFVLLLLDYWPLGRTPWVDAASGAKVKATPRRLLEEKVPLFALAAASCVVALWEQHAGGLVASMVGLPLGMRVANALLAYVEYICKTFWPLGLAVFYPVDEKLSAAAAVMAAVALLVITVAVIWRARREPWLATGWFWYLGMLLPVIGLVQVGSQSMADRYTYLPLVGLSMMVCWSVPSRAVNGATFRTIVCIAGVAWLVVCGVMSRIQVGYWKDSEALFRHALDVTQENWLAHNNLGVVLKDAGRNAEEISEYKEALRIKPAYADAHYNLGAALWESGNIEDAMPHLEAAVRIEPGNVDSRINLARALVRLGRVQEAIGHCEQALRIRPNSAEARFNLGVALERNGKDGEAIEYYEQAVRIKPDYAEAHNNLGAVLWRAGKTQEAIRRYEQALLINPDYVEAHYNLGGALEREGRVQEAIRHFEQALKVKPDFTPAQNELARLRAAP